VLGISNVYKIFKLSFIKLEFVRRVKNK